MPATAVRTPRFARLSAAAALAGFALSAAAAPAVAGRVGLDDVDVVLGGAYCPSLRRHG